VRACVRVAFLCDFKRRMFVFMRAGVSAYMCACLYK
jgi:hypothetical protein